MTTVYNNTLLHVLYWHGLPSNEPTGWTCYRSWPILADDNYGTQYRPSTPRSKPKYSHTTLFVPILGTSSESNMSNDMRSQSRLDYWLALVQHCSCCRSTCTCQTIFNVLQ